MTPEPTKKAEQRFPTEVGGKEERKIKAREENRSVWFGLGMFGMVGWAVAVPTVAAVALGVWLDGRYPGPPSWTLTLLVVGVAVGCLNAWFWIKRESKRD
ncbi:MAG: AtpZ/AtpI family protein [Pseudomonadota bacterium]